MFDKITKVQKSRLQLKTLAAIFGVLAVFVAPTLYSPKAAADAINDTDFVFTVDTRKPGSSDTRFVIPTRETDIIILLIAIMMVRSKQPLRPDLILAATLRLAYIRFVSEVCFQSFISITAAIN